MATKTQPVRLNIYLNDPALRRQIKIAAARHGVTLSAYCLEAIRDRLAREEFGTGLEARQQAAEALDRLRSRVGPIGIPVRELIAEGRRG